MKKRLFFGILNWGLGHAARSAPIIKHYQKQGHEIIIGSDGRALAFLQKTFPELTCIRLTSYQIKYPFENILLNIIWCSLPILRAIRSERKALQQMHQEKPFDAIISDNRYGLYLKGVPSFFISHMLYPMPTGNLRTLSALIIQYFVRPFKEIWVPDSEQIRLAGQFIYPIRYKNLRFIGLPTRMKKLPTAAEGKIVVLLSGPEPQRSILEKKLLDQASKLPYEFIFVLGKTEAEGSSNYKNCTIHQFLTGPPLNTLLNEAALVICRAGYSTLLDISILGTKAILIPTPGQAEQEYLAVYLENKHYYLKQDQATINLEKAIPRALKLKGLHYKHIPLQLPSI